MIIRSKCFKFEKSKLQSYHACNVMNDQTDFLDDEDDWLQVSDEESVASAPNTEIEYRLRPHPLVIDKNKLFCEESYRLTGSGSVLLRGLSKGIKLGGLGDKTPKNQAAMEDRLLMMNELGRGSCGVVYKAFDVIDRKVVAVKMISLKERSKRKQLVQELNTLQKNAQAEQYLLTCINAFAFSNTSSVGIIMPYISGGSLQNIIAKGGIQDEIILSVITRQCLLGLQALHKRNHIHRDLKVRLVFYKKTKDDKNN